MHRSNRKLITFENKVIDPAQEAKMRAIASISRAALAGLLFASTVVEGMIEVKLNRREVPRGDARLHRRPITAYKPSAAKTAIDQSVVESSIEEEYIITAMGNLANLQYYGELLIGSQHERHSFIFDTGSPWLWIANERCQNCHCDKS